MIIPLLEVELIEERLRGDPLIGEYPVSSGLMLDDAMRVATRAPVSVWVYSEGLAAQDDGSYRNARVEMQEDIRVWLLVRDVSGDLDASRAAYMRSLRAAVVQRLRAWSPQAGWRRMRWGGSRLISAANRLFVVEERFYCTQIVEDL